MLRNLSLSQLIQIKYNDDKQISNHINLADKHKRPPAITCSHCSFRELCQLLEMTDRDNLTDFLTDRQIKQDDIALGKEAYLYQQGEVFENVYVVKHGTLKSVLPGGRIADFHLQGDFLGLDGFESGRHQLDVIATEGALICSFNFKTFLARTDQRQSVNSLLSRLFSRQLNHQFSHYMYPKTATQRICQLLVRLADHARQYGYSARRLYLPMQRQDMASYLELTAETVSRALKELKNQGIIALDNHQVTILDWQQIEQQGR